MWLAIQGRIQTGVALKQKNWKGDVNCNLCASPETVNHVLFQCVMARFVWASFKEALGWIYSITGFLWGAKIMSLNSLPL